MGYQEDKSLRIMKAAILISKEIDRVCPEDSLIKNIYNNIGFRTLDNYRYYIAKGKLSDEQILSTLNEDIERFFSMENSPT